MKNFLFLITVSFLLLLSSCSKNNNTDWIPYVPVNIDIYPANPQFISLYPVGGWVYLTGGSRGIIVYHYTQDEYYAFDRHCPYQPTNSCGKVKMDTDDITAVDTCCGSKFIVVDGSVIQGPAGLPLKQYQTNYDGTTLHITN
jgi:nitrite reductase/ring-hydroxylating ferredoxin subunit